jgi:hypothetical protein
VKEFDNLHRDITGLLEANRLDWVTIASGTLTPEQSTAFRSSISDRNGKLKDLFPRYLELKFNAIAGNAP